MLTYSPYPIPQSYQMHLKSSNGAIDVLVCPETEDDPPQSPCPSSGHLFSDSQTSTPLRYPISQVHMRTPETRQQDIYDISMSHQTTPTMSLEQGGRFMHSQLQNNLDISLSSAADVTSDLDELMASYSHVTVADEHHLMSADLIPFESLNPPLLIHDEDFSFALDDATEGIHELFDLVT